MPRNGYANYSFVIDSSFQPYSFAEMIKPFAIRRPYFLYASTMSSPLKRHCELIKAFEIFKKRTGLPHRLVLAGSEGDSRQQCKKRNDDFCFHDVKCCYNNLCSLIQPPSRPYTPHTRCPRRWRR